MKKHIFICCILTTLILLCCSCAPPKQTGDSWAYAQADGTWAEDNRKHYLEVMYLYENLRPTEQLSPADEPLLRLIDAHYKDVDAELYMPRENEIQYEEMQQLVLPMLEAFNIADRAPDLCFSYLRRSSIKPDCAEWVTVLLYEDGCPFQLVINANDGSFLKWARYPQGYWTYLQPEALPESQQELLKERTDEELLNTAKAYAEAVLVSGTSKIVESTAETTTASPYFEKAVTVFIHPHDVYKISIDYNDLSIIAVEREISIP